MDQATGQCLAAMLDAEIAKMRQTPIAPVITPPYVNDEVAIGAMANRAEASAAANQAAFERACAAPNRDYLNFTVETLPRVLVI